MVLMIKDIVSMKDTQTMKMYHLISLLKKEFTIMK